MLVGDPTFGLQTYTREEFEAVWNGVVLAIRARARGLAGAGVQPRRGMAPVGGRADRRSALAAVSPSDLTREFRELYQITPNTSDGLT